MKELQRIQDNLFKEIYEGINESTNTKVRAILDNYCVRYMVFKRTRPGAEWKRTACREFSNDKKDLCKKNATKALNK